MRNLPWFLRLQRQSHDFAEALSEGRRIRKAALRRRIETVPRRIDRHWCVRIFECGQAVLGCLAREDHRHGEAVLIGMLTQPSDKRSQSRKRLDEWRTLLSRPPR